MAGENPDWSDAKKEGYKSCLENSGLGTLRAVFNLNPYPLSPGDRWDSVPMKNHYQWSEGAECASYDLMDWGYWPDDEDGWNEEDGDDDD